MKASIQHALLTAPIFVLAYVGGAYPGTAHMPGYESLTVRTRLLQCGAEAALFLPPVVALLGWAIGRAEARYFAATKDLNLALAYLGALALGAVIGLASGLPWLVLLAWKLPPVYNLPFALACAGSGAMLFLTGLHSRRETVFRVLESSLWLAGATFAAWALFYR